ncbi:MAG: ATP-binding protein [Treponema sp.]|nr:ATP-binding protein [Treponema sp.]
MRLKAAFIIIVVAFVITVVNISSSLILIRNTLDITMSEDISLARDIVNDFISTRMDLYKSNARTAAEQLAKDDSYEDMEKDMQKLLAEYADFMAFTVFDRQGIVAEYGDSPTSINFLDQSKYIESAFNGRTVISTTKYNEATDKLVMYICTPMGQDRILSVTISGMIFSEILGSYILRDTRMIFMLDEYGTVIAHFLPDLVSSRTNLATDQGLFRPSIEFFNDMLANDKGQGNYIIDDIDYHCAYAKVSSSQTGWYICLSVPAHENLADKLEKRLLVLAVIFFAAGAAIAVVCSGQIAKPYNKIAEQNRRLEELMSETRRLQTELEAALKKAQDADRAKSSFLANMSHEMRTPLNAVIGLSELIINSREPSQQAVSQQAVRDSVEERINMIHSSGMTLLGIVNDILDISKIESGKFELHPVKYDTASLINDTVSQNIVLIGEKPIQFLLVMDENLPRQLFGDDLRIKQIFNNLLSNAFKYTNSGTVKWKLSFRRDGENIWLVSEVKDTGMGIKSEDLQKLFKDYSQIGSNRSMESTGLGLSITKSLVGMMNGIITAESEYGKGMTFTVMLCQHFVSDVPIGRETADNLIRSCFSDTKPVQIRERMDLSYASVLVVDDMLTNLDVAKGMLTPYGLHVDCASCGRQAIEMIRSEIRRYNAVFMDHMMPDMDGVETLRIIRGEIGTDYARNVPVIALTANAIAGNEKMFLDSGFQAFISKPINVKWLDSILRRWVGGGESETEKKFQPDKITIPLLLFDGISIEGINIDSIIESFAGNEEIYIKVLHSYAANTRPLMNDLKKYLDCGDLAEYAVAIHGIKGSSFGIGAMRAGKKAEQLERMVKESTADSKSFEPQIRRFMAEKTDYLFSKNESFINLMEILLNSIESALAAVGAKCRKPLAATPDPALLMELREACVEYDIGKVDKVMEKLDSYKYEKGGALITWLHEQVDDMSFSEITGGNWPDFGAKSA